MKIIVSIILIAAFVNFGNAQEGIVTIEQDAKISKLMDIYTRANSNTGYYTIQIGFGSYEDATKLKTESGIDFPQYSAKIVFDSPTYRVHMGRFKTKLEAERTFKEVRKKYTESIVLKPETIN